MSDLTRFHFQLNCLEQLSDKQLIEDARAQSESIMTSFGEPDDAALLEALADRLEERSYDHD